MTSDLFNLLDRIALCPNSRVCFEAFREFQSKFPKVVALDSITHSHELTQRSLLASDRLSRMKDVPQPLQELMQRLQTCAHHLVGLHPVLSLNLQAYFGDNALAQSLVNDYLTVAQSANLKISFSDLYVLLGSDWGAAKGSSFNGINVDFLHTLTAFYNRILVATEMRIGTQSTLWHRCGLGHHPHLLTSMLNDAQSGALKIPAASTIQMLQGTDEKIYIPVGYCNEAVFFTSLIAIDHRSSGYRLRLLAADNTHILAATENHHHYCPEVIWEGLDLETISREDIWQPLLEAATLTPEEIQKIAHSSRTDYFLAFNATHIVPWLVKKLGKKPASSRDHDTVEELWQTLEKNSFSSSRNILNNSQFKEATETTKDLVLKPTGKEMKRTVSVATFRKFVNLLALDLLPLKNQRLLYKAESRLLLLASAYLTLQQVAFAGQTRSDFLRLVEQSWGKVTAPIEELMQLDPTPEEQKAAQTLLVTTLDLKHRFHGTITENDKILLSAVQPLYPSTHTIHKLKLSDITHIPIRQTVLDALRVNYGQEPLPLYDKWTRDRFAEIYAKLERWYDILLDAKLKMEPAEIITMAHRNIFSKLPIPATDQLQETFPEELSEGLQVGTLLLLKKICSLVSSEAYSEAFISPLFVADMARVYRFCAELYRQINPAVRELPFSWYCLHEFMQNRHCSQLPGEIKTTLELVAASFKAISPKGHLEPSEEYKEIPLFYLPWDHFPIHYKYHLQSLGPLRLEPKTIDEVLSTTELADKVGLKPEEAEPGWKMSEEKWANSFNGQCVLALQEIAQYHTMTIFATTEGHKKSLQNKNFKTYDLHSYMGPDDHFQLPGVSSGKLDRYTNRFGGSWVKYGQQIVARETAMEHRMVAFSDKAIQKPIRDLPVKMVAEWREQADLIKALPKGGSHKEAYYLHQAASGPATLSIDLVLEYFEARSALLLNQDMRSYFMALFKSAQVLQSAATAEAMLLERLKAFIHGLYSEDRLQLHESNLNFERMLWLTSLCRHICRLSPKGNVDFGLLLGTILNELSSFSYDKPLEARLAPHLLASQQFLSKYHKLTLIQTARQHLLLGKNPPVDPNDFGVWFEACEAMQQLAPTIQNALVLGDEATRKALWGLILPREQDVLEVMQRPRQLMPIATLTKTAAEMDRLSRKSAYIARWTNYFKKHHLRENAWREEGTNRLKVIVEQQLSASAQMVKREVSTVVNAVQELLLTTPTTLLVKVGEKLISVDWETGRVAGASNQLPTSKRLPVHLRKHPDLAPLGQLLMRPLTLTNSSEVAFQGFEQLTVDISTGQTRLVVDEMKFRLIGSSLQQKIGLPQQLLEGFSIWMSETESQKYFALCVAHATDGTPKPCYWIDREGAIHPLHASRDLRMATSGYYPEAEIFSRWGIEPSTILVWLDDENNVAEMHLPLHNGENHFTRVTRTEKGWKIDGLEVLLQETNEAVGAFAGFPVYLVATNSTGQRLLLLSGSVPYKDKYDKREIDWNTIIAKGADTGIHQYRILKSGQVEGLTVADNLLLILWSIRMGSYKAAADLARRWLTPAGRPYSDDEQKLLATWINTGYGDSPMHQECHPSAKLLRLYCLVRIARHLRNYPTQGKNGKPMSKLAMQFIGPRDKSYKARGDIREHLTDRGALTRAGRGANLEDLLSTYDHEAIVRLFIEDYRTSNVDMTRRLYHRLTSNHPDHQKGLTEIDLAISGGIIIEHMDSAACLKAPFKELIGWYPRTAQDHIVPLDRMKRSIIPVELARFFDKAYTLIQAGPTGLKTEQEQLEYEAIVLEFHTMRNGRAKDLCTHYLWRDMSYYHDENFNTNNMLWLLLEQAYLAKRRGELLPELPTVERRFGLALLGSDEASKAFFKKLESFSGLDASTLLKNFRIDWFKERALRYLEQNTVNSKLPDEFSKTLKQKWSSQLTSEILRWSRMSRKDSPQPKEEVYLDGWSYPIPREWQNLPQDLLTAQVTERIDLLTKQKAKLQKELLLLCNALPEDENKKLFEFARQIHYREPLSIDECIHLAVRGTKEIQKATLLYLEAALELAHLERSLCDREQLMTPHTYLPSTETLPLMISEYYSDCRLRTQPDQALHVKVLSDEAPCFKGSVIQAIMGSGKSKMLAPAWLQNMLLKGYIPILCVPNSLFRTTLSDLQEMMWTRFRTHVRALTFDRESCTSDSLHALAESLHVGQLEPTVFVCAPRDLHALQLMLKERHQVIDDMRERLQRFAMSWARTNNLPNIEAALKDNDWASAHTATVWYESHCKLEEELKPLMAEADLMQSILNLLQNYAALLVDEVATAYDPRNLLSFPIGWQTPANPRAAYIGCKIYFDWLVPHYAELDLLNNMQSLSKEATRQEIYRKLAKKIRDEYLEFLPDMPPQEIFTAYMLSDREKGLDMQAYILKLHASQSIMTRQFAQELAFVKYCLTAGLEGALTSTGHVNYGRSKQDPHLYLAIPYQCANVPKENTLFRRPWKTVLMTCQHYSQGWNDPNQTAGLIGFLQGIDPTSKEQNVLKAAVKVWGRRFSDTDLANKEEMQKLTEDLDRARLLPEKADAARLLIRTYLESCVFSAQLKLDPSQLTSSPQDIPMIAKKSDAMGGTFGFETTWNPRLKRVPDHSSDETIMRALAKAENQQCHTIPRGGAHSLFGKLANCELQPYMALIDAGALFKGISNETVAKRLLEIRKGFDSVLFYEEDTTLAVMTKAGKTRLEVSDREGVRRALQKLKLTTPFVYYDQARRIGADLELKPGRALVTFSDNVTLDDLLQACMRCRWLLDGRHSVAFAIPEEMEGAWTGKLVVSTAKMQQTVAEEKANFHGVCEQLRGQLRAAIDKAMRSMSNSEFRHILHKRAQSFLMEEQDNDLVKTFGTLQGMMRASDALKRLTEQLAQRADFVLSGTKDTIAKELQSILEWHKTRGTLLPEWVREGDTQEDAVQEVDLSKDQDRMRLMEEEYERMLGTRNPKKEIAWSHFDPKQIKAHEFGSVSSAEGMPTLYRLKDALEERGYEVPIYSNVLVSANLLSTFQGESNCLITENQKPLHRCLYLRRGKDTKLVLVSENDARQLKEHLKKQPPEAAKGLFLIEPTGWVNQRACKEDEMLNLWSQGTKAERSMLLQVLLFQGAALTIDKLNKEEVKAALHFWTLDRQEQRHAIRLFFEAALDLRPDQMQHYRRSQNLRTLFA